MHTRVHAGNACVNAFISTRAPARFHVSLLFPLVNETRGWGEEEGRGGGGGGRDGREGDHPRGNGGNRRERKRDEHRIKREEARDERWRWGQVVSCAVKQED